MLNLDTRLLDLIPEIGADGFAILLLIAKRINSTNKAFPSIQTLEKESGFGRQKVCKCLARLREHELLTSKQRRVNGKLSSNIYTVTTRFISVFVTVNKFELDENEPCIENHNAETLDTENQHTANQCTENHTVSISHSSLSINNTNTKKDSVNTSQELTEIEYLETQRKKEKSSEKKEKKTKFTVQEIEEKINELLITRPIQANPEGINNFAYRFQMHYKTNGWRKNTGESITDKNIKTVINSWISRELTSNPNVLFIPLGRNIAGQSKNNKEKQQELSNQLTALTLNLPTKRSEY